jgi:endonuclease/exonuclease/phosphatase family metal-dependent hydrolase
MRRGFVAVTLGAHGLRMAVVSTHLGLSAKERERHAHELTDAVADLKLPVLLGADLNEEPAGPAVRWVGGLLVDAYAAVGETPGNTFPARRPTDRIDYVFANEDLRAIGAWVQTGPEVATASDHLPVVVDLEMS